MLTSCCALAVQLRPRSRMSKFIPFKESSQQRNKHHLHNKFSTFQYCHTMSIAHTIQQSHIFLTFRMSSRQVTSGDRPPWTHRNCWLSRAARGRQSKASMQASYTRSEYLILPAMREPQLKKHPCISEQAQAEWMSFSSQGCHTVRLTYHSNAVWVRADRGLPTFQGLRNRWRRRMSHALLGDVAADPRANWDELRKAAWREAD